MPIIETPPVDPAPSPEVLPMPNLTQEEKTAIGQAVSMLRPFAGQLIPLATSQATDEQIAEELAEYIPNGLIPSLEALAGIVARSGPGVLQVIHPRMVSPRWSTILPKIIEMLHA
jgi:hypothetical protein